MDTEFDIDKPGETCILKENSRCNIRCRTLKIERDVSFSGTVEAEEDVWIAGTFVGHLAAKTLRTGEFSNVRGDLRYEKLVAHPKARDPRPGFLVDERKFESALAAPPPAKTETKKRVLRLQF